jgi:pimeloyl-ACP methyl ester carboxylesterase
VIALLAAAYATPGFDPTSPAVRLEGEETWTQAGDVRLWNALERWEDPDRTLFRAESFNDAIAWQDTDWSPWIATAFGTATPPSSAFLLHVGLHEPTAEGTPILMVCGAGDNGSRGFVTLATHLDRLNRPVYALTFAHPHGDVLAQAEAVADAIAVIRARTGAAQVDLVGHSKGGIAAAVYASHHPDADWGRDDYAAVGTPYRGDVRRLVLIATPLGGVDTSYRWPGLNLYSLEADTALSPSSWARYYPTGTAFPTNFDALADQDFLPDGADLFPGQRQLLRRQPPELPGSKAWLGVYALQPDWYTTYEGGLGFESRSDGIDAAIDAGGHLIDRLAATGVDPAIEVYLLAGTSPILPNGDEDLAAQFDRLGAVVDYEELLADLDAHGLAVAADPAEIRGLEDGALVLGEISAESDGLVLATSALDTSAVDARGAVVVDAHTAELSHLDLLYASPITGDLLAEAADEGGPEDAWMRPFGERYTAADTIGWVERALADEPGDEPPATTPTAGEPADPDYPRPCGGCRTAAGPPAAFAWALALVWRRRSR